MLAEEEIHRSNDANRSGLEVEDDDFLPLHCIEDDLELVKMAVGQPLPLLALQVDCQTLSSCDLQNCLCFCYHRLRRR